MNGIDLIDTDPRPVKEVYALLKRETAKMGLTITSSKTTYMIASRDRGRPNDVGVKVVTDGDVFEVVILR